MIFNTKDLDRIGIPVTEVYINGSLCEVVFADYLIKYLTENPVDQVLQKLLLLKSMEREKYGKR